MSFSPERASVNQSLQLGIETTPGTAVPANKRVDCYMFSFTIKPSLKSMAGTGRKFPVVQQINSEYTDGTYSGSMDFNGLLYPLAGVYGVQTAAAHGSSTVAKDWVFDAVLSGAKQPQTLSIEQGESATRAQKFAYGLFTKLDYKITHQDASVSGNIIGQLVSDGITMTASPTAVALQPMTGQQTNIYLDPTSANLGMTQLTKFISVEFDYDNLYGPFWPLNRSQSSFASHVDLKPNCYVKIMAEADATGMALLNNMRVGSTQYLRVNVTGPVVDNNQTVNLGAPSAGTFTLTYKGQTTSGLAFNATSATVQTAFTGLSTVGAGNATVTGSAGGPYIITFAGTLALDTTAITGSGASLTGGTFTITQTQIYNTMQHDMAIKIGTPSAWQDNAGIYAIEWQCDVFEDSVWGHSNVVTVTNSIATL